jgi:signal transduction histidine kinase
VDFREAASPVIDALGEIFHAKLDVRLRAESPVTSAENDGPSHLARLALEASFRDGNLIVPFGTGSRTHGDVILGPMPEDSPWVSGMTIHRSLVGAVPSVKVPRLKLTGAYLTTIFSTIAETASEQPRVLGIAVDDMAVENMRRIGATLGGQFGVYPKDSDLRARARSFWRVRPLSDFVLKLSPNPDTDRLADLFRDVTGALPVGFHLVDVMVRSLIRTPKFADVCRRVFRAYAPLPCVLSDVTKLWWAFLRHRIAPLDGEIYSCPCPGGFTEVFAPLFSDNLAIGGIYTGQIVKSDEQREIVERKALEIARDRAADISRWMRGVEVCRDKTLEHVKRVCVGLGGLTEATFTQWCRAENDSDIRRDLIEASKEATLRDFVVALCKMILQFFAVDECSIWISREDRVILTGASSSFFYIRTVAGGSATKTATAELLDKAFYLLGEGLTGKVAKEQKPLKVRDASVESEWFGKFSETPPGKTTQVMAIPLVHGEELWGVVRASKTLESTEIPESDFEFLKDIAAEIAICVRAKVLAERAEAEAERFKFIMKVGAHEFRGPLNSIVSLLTVLSDRLASQPSEIHEKFKMIEEQAYRAKTQMDNALTFDMEAPVNCGEESLGLLFMAAEREFTARAAQRNIKIIVWDSAKKLPKIQMDGNRMAQVITNLLDNAVKYSFKGEKIHIRGWQSDTMVRFSVQNWGLGIPEAFHEAVFEPFQRKVVEDKTRFIAGTGMGLPIVKQIVAAHKGRVKLTSEPFLDDPRRQGAEHGHIVTFMVELPRSVERKDQ